MTLSVKVSSELNEKEFSEILKNCVNSVDLGQDCLPRLPKIVFFIIKRCCKSPLVITKSFNWSNVVSLLVTTPARLDGLVSFDGFRGVLSICPEVMLAEQLNQL